MLEKTSLKPDYELPKVFEYSDKEVKTNFVCDFLYCCCPFTCGKYSFNRKVLVPYFAIDEIIDMGNYVQIKLFEDISPYNNMFDEIKKDTPLFVYFEYEIDKIAVLEHFNNLKKTL